MNSNMRQALGLASRGHLALESEEPDPVEDTNEKLNVVMKGPLAAVYTDALDIAFNKDGSGDPAVEPPADATPPTDNAAVPPTDGGEPPAETPPVEALVPDTTEPVEEETAANVTNVVLESMAVDAAVLQSMHNGMTEEAPSEEEATDYMTLYAVDQTDIQPETVIEVTELLKNTETPENVTVLIDNVLPPIEGPEPSPEEVAQDAAMVLGLENIVVGLGGKVVHSFKDFVAANRKA